MHNQSHTIFHTTFVSHLFGFRPVLDHMLHTAQFACKISECTIRNESSAILSRRYFTHNREIPFVDNAVWNSLLLSHTRHKLSGCKERSVLVLVCSIRGVLDRFHRENQSIRTNVAPFSIWKPAFATSVSTSISEGLIDCNCLSQCEKNRAPIELHRLGNRSKVTFLYACIFYNYPVSIQYNIVESETRQEPMLLQFKLFRINNSDGNAIWRSKCSH